MKAQRQQIQIAMLVPIVLVFSWLRLTIRDYTPIVMIVPKKRPTTLRAPPLLAALTGKVRSAPNSREIGIAERTDAPEKNDPVIVSQKFSCEKVRFRNANETKANMETNTVKNRYAFVFPKIGAIM
jgi:hypothetical protein